MSAQQELSNGFKASGVRPEAVPKPVLFPMHCHPRWRQPIGDLDPQSPKGSPLCAIASAGMTSEGEALSTALVKQGFHQNRSRRGNSPLPLGEGSGVRALHSQYQRMRASTFHPVSTNPLLRKGPLTPVPSPPQGARGDHAQKNAPTFRSGRSLSRWPQASSGLFNHSCHNACTTRRAYARQIDICWCRLSPQVLFNHSCHNACTNGAAAFADSEAQALGHRDRGDEVDYSFEGFGGGGGGGGGDGGGGDGDGGRGMLSLLVKGIGGGGGGRAINSLSLGLL